MAMTEQQQQRLLGSLDIRDRSRAVGAEVDGVSNREARVLREVDAAARVSRSVDDAARMKESNLTVNQPKRMAGFIPIHLPQTPEESGLVPADLILDESQEAARKIIASERFVCLIGAAGTGKTTMVKRGLASIIYGDEEAGIEPRGIRSLSADRTSIAICAFTGQAQRVIRNSLPSWLHASCETIHSLLEFKPTQGDEESGMFYPTRNAQNKLDQDIIVVEETSMVGLDLWQMLIEAMRPETKIICIGDLNQLPPVADAPFFPFALDAAVNRYQGWALAPLTTVHRQVGEGANRILDAAHAVIGGKRPVFDLTLGQDGKPKPGTEIRQDWKTASIELSSQPAQAHKQIIAWMRRFQTTPTPEDASRMVYDPYSDLLLTAGNGDGSEAPGRVVEQAPLNASLSRLIIPETDDNPVYVIDAGRVIRTYAIGDRVMCRQNEAPGTKDRITNGTRGVIVDIQPNPNWRGEAGRFGKRKDVQAMDAMQNAREAALDMAGNSLDSLANAIFEGDMGANGGWADPNERTDKRRAASHVVTIDYSGVVRKYASAAGVEKTQLAYASTVHTAQGSQAESVFIVCHSAAPARISREWLYTALTRTSKRFIVFQTDLGLRKALARQQIFGATIPAKVENYIRQADKKGHEAQLVPYSH